VERRRQRQMCIRDRINTMPIKAKINKNKRLIHFISHSF
jgi:hypothetical protein